MCLDYCEFFFLNGDFPHLRKCGCFSTSQCRTVCCFYHVPVPHVHWHIFPVVPINPFSIHEVSIRCQTSNLQSSVLHLSHGFIVHSFAVQLPMHLWPNGWQGFVFLYKYTWFIANSHVPCLTVLLQPHAFFSILMTLFMKSKLGNTSMISLSDLGYVTTNCLCFIWVTDSPFAFLPFNSPSSCSHGGNCSCVTKRWNICGPSGLVSKLLRFVS